MPPQAYTKETLQEAFEWWSDQSDEFRSQIQDKDDLVGYYLRENRGEGFTKTAKESFSSELKGLAKDLEDFEGYQPPKSQATQQTPVQPKKPVFEPSIQLQFPDMSKPLIPSSGDQAVKSSALVKKSQGSLTQASGPFYKLDERSKASLQKAKAALNLSSDEEALRALIALGEAKISSLF